MRSRPDQPWAASTGRSSSSSVSWLRASYGRQASRSSSRNERASVYMTSILPADRTSDEDRFPVLPEDAAQDAALLPERRVGLGAPNEVGHEVRVARARA